MPRPCQPVAGRLIAKSESVKGSMSSVCRVWTGSRNAEGYGKISVRGKCRAVHRAAYEVWVGPIPEGMHLDHLCRNPACFNPLHLEPVTNAENLRRGHAARGTLGGRSGERKRAAQARYYQRKKAA